MGSEKLKGPERARNGIRRPERVGGKPERAARGQRVPGMERERQRERKSARKVPESARDRMRAPERAKKCQKGARECQIPPKNFPQVFKQGFFLRFLERVRSARQRMPKSARESTKKRARECQGSDESARESEKVPERCQRVPGIG